MRAHTKSASSIKFWSLYIQLCQLCNTQLVNDAIRVEETPRQAFELKYNSEKSSVTGYLLEFHWRLLHCSNSLRIEIILLSNNFFVFLSADIARRIANWLSAQLFSSPVCLWFSSVPQPQAWNAYDFRSCQSLCRELWVFQWTSTRDWDQQWRACNSNPGTAGLNNVVDVLCLSYEIAHKILFFSFARQQPQLPWKGTEREAYFLVKSENRG